MVIFLLKAECGTLNTTKNTTSIKISHVVVVITTRTTTSTRISRISSRAQVVIRPKKRSDGTCRSDGFLLILPMKATSPGGLKMEAVTASDSRKTQVAPSQLLTESRLEPFKPQLPDTQALSNTASASKQCLIISNLTTASNKNHIIFDAFLLRGLLLILEELFWARTKNLIFNAKHSFIQI